MSFYDGKSQTMRGICAELLSSKYNYFDSIKQAVNLLDNSVSKHNPVKHAAVIAAIAGLTTFCTPCAEADYIPTLDRTDIPELAGYSSSYTMTTTTETSGTGIYNIPDYDPETYTLTDHYYQFAEKPDIDKETIKYTNSSSLTETDKKGYWYNFSSSGSGTLYGSAFYNTKTGELHNVIGDFKNNRANRSGSYAYGGTFSNAGTINDIILDAIGNSHRTTSSSYSTTYGSLYNSGTINSIKGNFINNYSDNSCSSYGSSISNVGGHITTIDGLFVGNYIKSTRFYANGGAISTNNNGKIDNIMGTYIRNYLHTYSAGVGGAIVGFSSSVIENISANFIENYVYYPDSGASSGYFALGGAIGLYGDTRIYKINSNFIRNHVYGRTAKGGAIGNEAIIDEISGIFIDNYAESINSNGAKGGAIYSNQDIKISADNMTTLFQGNYTKNGSTIDDNAIYIDGSSKKLTFDIKNGGSVYMYDNIRGVSGYSVDIKGADKTADKMYLFNDIYGANVSLDNVELNTINNDIHTYNFNTLNLANDFNMAVDVDLQNEVMDRLTATNVTGSGKINVVGMNLKNDMSDGKDTAHILFADNNLKNKVSETTLDLDNTHPYQTTAYSPIYKYTAIYNVEDDGGYFNFTRGGLNPQPTPGPSPDNFNPAVLAQPVAAQANVMAINNIVANYAFHHVDTCMGHAHGHLSSRYLNRYALADTTTAVIPAQAGIAQSLQNTQNMRLRNKSAMTDNRLALIDTPVKDDLNTNNPLFIEPDKESVWVKPFVTFENIPLKNGPNVKSINYGTLIGYDSQVFHHKRGFDGVWTGYVGYNGSNMHYSGVDSNSNGGLLGATYSLYKGNFFNATTLTTGAMHTQARTMYGNDNMTSLYAGIGNKTGYNFNFNEGLFTIQPNFLISYTFGKTFDFTNAAGVRINSDPIHAIQLSPGIKFFMNTKNGWQPYIGVNMVWNIMDQTHARANGVKLPEMSVKPYVQYGVGVQKVMKDHFTAYGQAMIQNGGRNGISLTAGFKWALGKNKKKIEKVEKPTEVKKARGQADNLNNSSKPKAIQTSNKHVLKG